MKKEDERSGNILKNIGELCIMDKDCNKAKNGIDATIKQDHSEYDGKLKVGDKLERK